MSTIDVGHGRRMDDLYGRQRHIYDATRRYYLLGRDRLIRDLDPPAGGSVLEVGCGTGRNLFAAAERYPDARFYGFDVSSRMLETALRRAGRHPMRKAITFAEADAARFDPAATFGVAGFDRVFVSYVLSMIPEWREALARAVAAVAPGGRLHVVDFGQQEDLPSAFSAVLRAWLALFHTRPRRELRRELESLTTAVGGRAEFQSRHRGYAWSLTLTRPSL